MVSRTYLTPSLVPKPSLAPVFDCFQYAKTDESYYVILATGDVKDSRHGDIHIYISGYGVAEETRQVPAERRVLLLEHNQL